MKDSTRICSFEGCSNPISRKGFCNGHYIQQWKGLELKPLLPKTPEGRFWSKVNKSAQNGCWEWTGAITGAGYGHIQIDGRLQGAHRVSWVWANGPIPEGLFVDHRCANRRCVNPEHLRVVTNTENLQHRTALNKNSTSGARGVSWHRQGKAWEASAHLNGRKYSAGLHPTIEVAEAAARALRARLHTHDDHDEWLAGNA